MVSTLWTLLVFLRRLTLLAGFVPFSGAKVKFWGSNILAKPKNKQILTHFWPWPSPSPHKSQLIIKRTKSLDRSTIRFRDSELFVRTFVTIIVRKCIRKFIRILVEILFRIFVFIIKTLNIFYQTWQPLSEACETMAGKEFFILLSKGFFIYIYRSSMFLYLKIHQYHVLYHNGSLSPQY